MKDLNLGKKQASGQKWSFLNQDLPALPFFSQYVNFSKVSFMIQFFYFFNSNIVSWNGTELKYLLTNCVLNPGLNLIPINKKSMPWA